VLGGRGASSDSPCSAASTRIHTIRSIRGHPVGGDARTVHRGAKPARYEIRVRGLLGETLLSAFPGLHAELRAGETVLAGELPDQAALYGVLTRIEALGLELLEVRRECSRPRPGDRRG
jgi:hypothetical protein